MVDKRKRPVNSNSNVENITNAVANLKRRLGLTTNQAIAMLANNSRPGTSRQHRLAQTVRQAAARQQAPQSNAGSNAVQRVMNSTDMLQELAKKMNSRTLAAFGRVGRQQRDAAREQIEAVPSFFDRTAVRSRGRPTTKADRLRLSSFPGVTPQSRITDRIPGRRYATISRDELVRHMQHMLTIAARYRVSSAYKSAFDNFYYRVQESLFAAAMEDPYSAVTRDLQSLMDVLGGSASGRYFYRDNEQQIMAVIRRMGKPALYIVSVHLGLSQSLVTVA